MQERYIKFSTLKKWQWSLTILVTYYQLITDQTQLGFIAYALLLCLATYKLAKWWQLI